MKFKKFRKEDHFKKLKDTLIFRRGFDIILAFVFLFIGIIIERITDISNKIIHMDITELNEKFNETHKSQMKLEDQLIYKYQLLKDYFPKGYLVYRFMPNGESYIIEYPGLWAVKSKSISFHKTDGNKWYIDYFIKQVYSERNIKIDGSGIMSAPVDFNKHLEFQDISIMIIDDLHFGFLLLDNDINAPIFAIGLTSSENISKKIDSFLNN